MSGETPRSRRAHAGWLAVLLLCAPFVGGAKSCDSGVVGDECPKGSKAAASAKCGGGSGQEPDAGNGGEVTSCGGLTGAACPDGEYCNFPAEAKCGAADQTGTCAKKPEVCTEQYAPVCGCDGKTYGNGCNAAGAGVSIARSGECTTTPPPPSDGVCGGLRGVTCGKGQYCNFPIGAMCGAADQTGKCTDIPQACDLIYAPVCGCDGKTYGSACSAAGAGVSVAKEGACATSPKPDAGTVSSCGGLVGAQCAKGEYCSFPDGQCGAADQTGTCVRRPDACDAIYAPVCGCDGMTYGNSCEAATAGVSVGSKGACPTTPPTGAVCGGLLGAQCPKGSFCNIPIGGLCGAADQTGNCTPIPTGCTKELNPVCGCDGNTYGNPCMAAAAGVSARTAGACPSSGNGQVCGTRGATPCPAGQFCNYPASAMCGVTDIGGQCAATPQACTEVYSPVCGCNNATFSNACFANAAGVSVKTTGPCK